jgi:hypothetical protein
MQNGLKINFVTLNEFNKREGVNPRTTAVIEHGITEPNLVSGKYQVEDTVIKTAEDPTELDPTKTTHAAAGCNTGILIANGVKFHSHMMFNLSSNDTVDPLEAIKKQFPEKINEFFDQLDQLIRSGQHKGKTINLDYVHSGGLAEILNNDPNASAVIQTSTELKDLLWNMIQDRIAQTQEKVKQNDIQINFSKSIFWGQKLIGQSQSPTGKTLSSWTNMHYDPKSNTLSINARRGTMGHEALHSIEDYPVEASGQSIATHYSQIELSENHLSEIGLNAATNLFIKANQKSVLEGLKNIVAKSKITLVGEHHLPWLDPLRIEIANTISSLKEEGLTRVAVEISSHEQGRLDSLDYSKSFDELKKEIRHPYMAPVLIAAKKAGLKVICLDQQKPEGINDKAYKELSYDGNYQNARDRHMFDTLIPHLNDRSKILIYIGSAHVHKSSVQKDNDAIPIKRIGALLTEYCGADQVRSIRSVLADHSFEDLLLSKKPSLKTLMPNHQGFMILPDQGPIKGDPRISNADYIITGQ